MESSDGVMEASNKEKKFAEDIKEELDESINTTCILIDSLTEEEEKDFCNGSLSLDLSEHIITVRIFGKLLSIAERNSSNRNDAISNMLYCSSPNLKDHTLHISNIVRKYQCITKKAEIQTTEGERNTYLNQELISVPDTRPELEKVFDIQKLKQGQLECSHDIEMTQGLFIKLGEFIKKHPVLTRSAVSQWAAKTFSISPPTRSAIYKDFKQLKLDKDRLRRNPIARETMLKATYVSPQPKPAIKPENKLLDMGNIPSTSQGSSAQGLGHDNYLSPPNKDTHASNKNVMTDLIDCYETMSSMTLAMNGLQESLSEALDEADDIKKAYRKDVNTLTYQLSSYKRRYKTVRAKLNETISRYKPRNVTKRETRKDLDILEQQDFFY